MWPLAEAVPPSVAVVVPSIFETETPAPRDAVDASPLAVDEVVFDAEIEMSPPAVIELEPITCVTALLETIDVAAAASVAGSACAASVAVELEVTWEVVARVTPPLAETVTPSSVTVEVTVGRTIAVWVPAGSGGVDVALAVTSISVPVRLPPVRATVAVADTSPVPLGVFCVSAATRWIAPAWIAAALAVIFSALTVRVADPSGTARGGTFSHPPDWG